MMIRLGLCALLTGATLVAQQPGQPREQFRAGVSLVTVDAYVSKDGVAITDLRPDEIEVLEDGVVQKVENFRLVRGRQPLATAATESDPSVRRAELTDPDARVFAIFFDTWHINMEGSIKGAAPIAGLLEKVIGADDLVGWTTPDLSARSMPLTRRTAGIQRMLEQTKLWGERDRVSTDPREAELLACYHEDDFPGVAKELIERRRERKTLLALDELVTHLGTLRDDRKFVLLLTEGWVQFRTNHRLSRELRDAVPPQAPVRVGSDGRLTTEAPAGNVDFDSCERERVTLALLDHSSKLERLAQRANRHNVSLYVVDPRGATPFDDANGPLRPASPLADRARLESRQDGLRVLAEQTGGVALLNATYTRELTARMMADLGSYYLMTYNSTNAKNDGRFRKLAVRVKRPGVDVRARPGYLAPTEGEVRAGGIAMTAAGPPASITRALEGMVQARGNLPARIQASGGRGLIRAVVELDAATARRPEWAKGGTLRVTIEPERGSGTAKPTPLQSVTVDLAAGQKSISVDGFDATLAVGRYAVRAEITPRAGRVPLTVTTFASVPAETAAVGEGVLALRRGPSTGLAYVPTADQRFRRTERLRLEVPLLSEGITGTGRVLTREGQPMPLGVTYSTRADEARKLSFGVADVTLSPLAAGEYVVELSLERHGTTETAVYGFRIIP